MSSGNRGRFLWIDRQCNKDPGEPEQTKKIPESRIRILMKGNVSLQNLPEGQEVWLVVCVSGVSYSQTKTGKRYAEAAAGNATGNINLKCWSETLDRHGELRAGLYGLTGALTVYREQQQFVLSSFSSIDDATYRAHQPGEPPLPRAFTFDLESVPQQRYRERSSAQLRRSYESGMLPADRLRRYERSREAEEERVYREGALYGTTAEVIAVAVHVAPQAEFSHLEVEAREYIFGIDEGGGSVDERTLIESFFALLRGEYDSSTPAFKVGVDELVTFCGRSFDYPLLLQRATVHHLVVPQLIDRRAYYPGGMIDVHREWLGGAKPGQSKLDDLAWALGLESSKREEVDGSKVLDLWRSGNLLAIRDYVRADARLTRRIYDRLLSSWGRSG